jgi:hypothetical protein
VVVAAPAPTRDRALVIQQNRAMSAQKNVSPVMQLMFEMISTPV